MRYQNALELWGGVECTINRVRDDYFEQLDRCGHTSRLDDLDQFAELGIKALRQPVLWERTAPGSLKDADWNFADQRLSRLRALNIRPIIGLIHHGSGPANTSLLDNDFPTKLANYARIVAERYTWVDDYTPVNEPLTTARFSALYGHWYPHARNDRAFVTALLHQCRATVLAMREIRKLNPLARLIQTDDLGKTFSTRTLAYQAEFENERRWLSWDLLCGRVGSTHPLWEYLLSAGADTREVLWFQENSCPPDVIGVNYYLSSERFLDEDVMCYPTEPQGSNGWHTYVDVLAVRARAEGAAGPRQILREALDRYGLPVAVTEVHNGCTREEQLRWLVEVWEATCELRADGADIPAITLWSLLGAHDWNSLVTCKNDHYEPGVFDIRSARPRATAIAKIAKSLAEGKHPEHPLLSVPGWWHRPERMIYAAHESQPGAYHAVSPLLISGGGGNLARAFSRACTARGIPHRLLLSSELDITRSHSISSALDEFHPWGVVNCAGYVWVDDAELETERCRLENSKGPALLAAECARRNVPMLTFSSDLVFDGTKAAPYVESDSVSPLSVYGRSKAEAEEHVLRCGPTALVIRSSTFFSAFDDRNFVTLALRTIATGKRFRAAADYLFSPTYVPDLVNAALDLLIDGEHGIWHLANVGATSWAGLAQRAACAAGLDENLVQPVTLDELALPAPRPSFSVLASEKAWIMPSLDSAIERYAVAANLQLHLAIEPAVSAD